MPCTTILIGKKASYDGSTIVARNEDAPSGEFTPKVFKVVVPADQPRHYKSVISHVEIDLPDDPMRYTSLPNALLDEGIWGEAGVNEANVSMSATETLANNERALGADPLVELVKAQGTEGEPGYVPEKPGGIGEEDMLTIVLPYVRTAREGVARLGALLEQFGTYEVNGIAFSDVDEIWWLETVGGHHWIARRVPDEAYVTMPNQLGIDFFDLSDAFGDQREFMCSADLREFMADAHLDLTLRLPDDADAPSPDVFNPREAFGTASDADHVYNTPRAWSMQRHLNPRTCLWDGIDADLAPEADDIPWAVVPERKLTVEDVKYVLSLHYQGTDYDPYGRFASQGGKYRPIGINRNCQLSVVQLRPGMPDAACALQWVAYGCNVFNALVPFYADVDATPEYLANTASVPSTESFYWANRLVAVMCDGHFHTCAPHVERYQSKVVSAARAIVAETDARVCAEGLGYREAAPTLAEANGRIAAMLRRETDDLLGKVLYTASCGMKNGFARSDV